MRGGLTMLASRASRGGHRLLSVLAALVLVLIMGATPALADDGTPGGDVELTEAQKQQAHDELVPLVVKQICEESIGGTIVSIIPGGSPACNALVGEALPKSFESLQAFQQSIESGAFCKAVAGGMPVPANLVFEGG